MTPPTQHAKTPFVPDSQYGRTAICKARRALSLLLYSAAQGRRGDHPQRQRKSFPAKQREKMSFFFGTTLNLGRPHCSPHYSAIYGERVVYESVTKRKVFATLSLAAPIRSVSITVILVILHTYPSLLRPVQGTTTPTSLLQSCTGTR